MPDATATKAKGKKGKLKGWQYAAIVGAAGVVYYLYRQHAANSAAAQSATTGAIDPLTGAPYASEVGAGAIDPATGQTYSSELAAAGAQTGTGAIDPATGASYASELAQANLLTGEGAIDPSTGATWASELQQALSQASAVVSGGGGGGYVPPDNNPPPPTPSAPTTGSGDPLTAWKAAVAAQLKKIRPELNSSQVSNIVNGYLSGKTLPDPASASWLKQAVGNVGAPPVRNGSSLPIKVASAKSSLHAIVATVTHPTAHVATPKGGTPRPSPVHKKKGPAVTARTPEVELVPNPPSTDRLKV